jgi:hypothetical protein
VAYRNYFIGAIPRGFPGKVVPLVDFQEVAFHWYEFHLVALVAKLLDSGILSEIEGWHS